MMDLQTMMASTGSGSLFPQRRLNDLFTLSVGDTTVTVVVPWKQKHSQQPTQLLCRCSLVFSVFAGKSGSLFGPVQLGTSIACRTPEIKLRLSLYKDLFREPRLNLANGKEILSSIALNAAGETMYCSRLFSTGSLTMTA